MIRIGDTKRFYPAGRAGLLPAWALLALVTTGMSIPERAAYAEAGQCTQSCQASYAQCYKATGSNRKVCEAQLQQCLARCIDKR